MDGAQFDSLTKSLSQGWSRRRAISALAGSLAAVAFGRRAEAACAGKPCGHACCDGTCCSHAGDVCTDAGACCPQRRTCGIHCCPPENVGCTEISLPDGSVRIGCRCPDGEYLSDNQCLPCHKRHKTCSGGIQCCSGVCCSGRCCPAGQVCAEAGFCQCPPDQLTCGDVCCPLDHICDGSACACPKGLHDCDGVCRDRQNDPSNCGSCGHVCQEGHICKNGHCVCPEKNCGGKCCAADATCCHHGGCCQTGTHCCPNGCCPDGEQCCGGGCCPMHQTCCHDIGKCAFEGTFCCGKGLCENGQICVDFACVG